MGIFFIYSILKKVQKVFIVYISVYTSLSCNKWFINKYFVVCVVCAIERHECKQSLRLLSSEFKWRSFVK